jgi:SAM-dependent methyltransferase
MKRGMSTQDDRNYEHSKGFDNYNSISKYNFNSAIELGCGPFTNLRIIANNIKVKSCTLLDPLIDDYFSHRFCHFSKQFLYVDRNNWLLTKFRRVFPKLFRKFQDIINDRIPIKDFINLPIEVMPLNKKYDLIVMINVIEHCYDVNLVFKNILDISDKNSIFVFHDKLYQKDKLIKDLSFIYDAAHPLRVDKKVIETFIKDNFFPLYTRYQDKPLTFCGETFLFEEVFFMGLRK